MNPSTGSLNHQNHVVLPNPSIRNNKRTPRVKQSEFHRVYIFLGIKHVDPVYDLSLFLHRPFIKVLICHFTMSFLATGPNPISLQISWEIPSQENS